MKNPSPYACDVCGVSKQQTNKWWLGFKRVNMIAIQPWDNMLAEQDADHLCGLTCVGTWITQKMHEVLEAEKQK